MDVDSFIAKYEGEWRTLETACAKGASGITSRSGEEVSEVVRLYLRASGHLTEVRARYHDPRLEAYLNGLVVRSHGAIYSGKPKSVHGAVRLFGERYRAAIRDTTRFIVVAAAILLVVTVASMVWVMNSAEVRAGVLPPGTRERIVQSGGQPRPGLGPPPGLSTMIFVNNVRVSFVAFALGITLVGTVYALVSNALTLGVLAGAYTAFGQGWGFWALILPHGFLELMAICIAAGAGLRMGWAWVEPGDRLRAKALREEAAGAVTVVVGVIPAFGIAALIEGFITSSTLPGAIKVAIGAIVAGGYLAFLYGPPANRATGAPRS